MDNNWQKILVSPEQTIQDVLVIIEKQPLKMALVVGQGNQLLGTVTDGDIRRGLINEMTLSTPVAEIMNTTPIVSNADYCRETLLKLMEDKGISSIPIVNSQGELVGLELQTASVLKKQYDNPVFLMAGGFGTRLRPLTDNCPKPLLKVGDKPILETVLLSFIRSGFHSFYISTHYLPEMIRDYFGDGSKWGISITYIHEESPLGTGGALGLLPADLPELPIVVMNGDVLTKIDIAKLVEFHDENDALATMCVREYEYQVPFGVVSTQGQLIKGMVEKPVQRFHVNAGIYVVGREVVESVKKNEKIDMPSLFERFIGRDLMVFPFHEYWLDIGRMDDFKRAQMDIKTLGLE